MEHTNQLLLITGANGGIGAALVDYLLRHNFRHIACHYYSTADNIEKILQKHGLNPEQHLFKADLTSEDDVASMHEDIEKKLGQVYGLVNLAGGSSNAMSWKLSLDEFQHIININLTSTFLCSRAFIPSMRANATGRIINISSIVGVTGIAGASHYCAAKAGILGLSKSLAQELAQKNITVNVLALGYFNCGLIDHVPLAMQETIKQKIPLGRFGCVDEIGGALKYLLSDEGVYVTGQTLHINGGLYT